MGYKRLWGLLIPVLISSCYSQVGSRYDEHYVPQRSSLVDDTYIPGESPLVRLPTSHKMIVVKQTVISSTPLLQNIVRRLVVGDTIVVMGVTRHTYLSFKVDSGYVDRHAVIEPAALEVATFPLQFTLPASVSNEAWGRANKFVSEYGSMKLQLASDYLLQTYSPLGVDHYGYTIVRAPQGDSVEFTVTCVPPDQARDFAYRLESAASNARVAACYIATGRLYPTLVEN